MEYKGQSKDRRRQEGEERNEAWRKLTPLQQLQVLDNRPGECKRQRGKIQQLLGFEKPKLSAKQAVAILAAVAVSLPSPLLDQLIPNIEVDI